MPDNDQGPGTSDWWTFVQDHELDPTGDPEPTYVTFSGPQGSGVTIILPNGTEVEVTLDRYQENNGYPTLVTVSPDLDRYPTPYGDPLRHNQERLTRHAHR